MAQDETDWRSRYRQILGEKVELEEQLQAEITSLRRSLGKIGVATEGLVADIDADLRRLRQAIADEKSSVELQALIESIAATMVQVDERRGQQGLERGRFLAALTGQLERLKLDLPATIRSGLRKTAKAVEQHPQQDPAAFERLVPQLMAIIEYQNTGKLASPSDNPSLLTRLFGSKTEVVEVAVAEAVPLDLSLLIEPMQRLMASLTQDSPQQTQLSKLSQRLAQVGSLEELADLLQQLSELLVELNSQEQLQFEQFLQQLTSRLDLIQGFLADSGQSFEQGNQLDQQVRSQVQGLQKSVREATTLPALQQAVQQRLDTILANLDQFQEKQRDLQRSSELKIARLKTQLQETEKESSLLRDNLVKQRLQAMTDSLTQLPNRFAYQVRLRHEYLRWHRHGAPLSLVIMDIDFFKKINDTYGHLAGDKVLAGVGRVLTEAIRETDFVARYGGEEFILLLPETSLPEATKLANKLRLRVQENCINYQNQTIVVTLSAGISDFAGDDEADMVLARADAALYRAKQMGRNQVCCEMSPSRRKG